MTARLNNSFLKKKINNFNCNSNHKTLLTYCSTKRQKIEANDKYIYELDNLLKAIYKIVVKLPFYGGLTCFHKRLFLFRNFIHFSSIMSAIPMTVSLDDCIYEGNV